ncbi:MAG: hypothetical protein HFG69_07290 [Hungatella sp.]|nr:hypothetical protein [Hungatella sp.]
MLTIIFFAALVWVAWKMLVLGIKATWGIAKIFCTILLLLLFIVGLMFVELFYIAIPILIIAGLVAIIGGIAET